MKPVAAWLDQKYTSMALAKLSAPGQSASYVAQISYNANAAWYDMQTIWNDGGTEKSEYFHTAAGTAPNDGNWRNTKISIRPDGLVEFRYRLSSAPDYTLAYTSLHPITSSYDDLVGVEVGCRASLYDNVQ